LIAFRLWIIGSSVIYVYFIINGKWIENREYSSKAEKFRNFISIGAFIALFLTIFHGIGQAIPFIKMVSFYSWEWDIYIPAQAAIALILSIWFASSIEKRYLEIPMLKDTITQLQDVEDENRELKSLLQDEEIYNRELETEIEEIEKKGYK